MSQLRSVTSREPRAAGVALESFCGGGGGGAIAAAIEDDEAAAPCP